jgi:hypothetical protein
VSLSASIFELIGEIICSILEVPYDGLCPRCRGDLRWVSYFSRERRIRCLECKCEWGRLVMVAGRSSIRKIQPRAAFTSVCQLRGRRTSLEILSDFIFKEDFSTGPLTRAATRRRYNSLGQATAAKRRERRPK